MNYVKKSLLIVQRETSTRFIHGSRNRHLYLRRYCNIRLPPSFQASWRDTNPEFRGTLENFSLATRCSKCPSRPPFNSMTMYSSLLTRRTASAVISRSSDTTRLNLPAFFRRCRSYLIRLVTLTHVTPLTFSNFSVVQTRSHHNHRCWTEPIPRAREGTGHFLP